MAPVPAPKTAADAVGGALHQPIDRADLPLGAGAYVTRGESGDKIKLLIASEVGGDAPVPGPVTWGYLISRANAVITEAQHQAERPMAPLVVTASVQLDPGQYELKFAAIDADGRVGSITFPVDAHLHGTTDVRLGDLVLGAASGNRVAPRGRVAQGSDLIALIDIYANDPSRLQSLAVTLEVSGAQPIAARRMSTQPGSGPTVLSAQTTLSTEGLAPGRYVAKAVVRRGDQTLVEAARKIDVIR